jgi:hypothetical protein
MSNAYIMEFLYMRQAKLKLQIIWKEGGEEF